MSVRFVPVLVAVLLAGAALGAPIACAADLDNTPRIDWRDQRQENRIEQGVNSGSLTPREATRLERGQTRVDHMQNRAAANGVVSARERARITRAQNVQSRRIARKKHNARGN
jgi:hypothetical protein